jgi:MerR family mercuric resistance operon transcriptional regulator
VKPSPEKPPTIGFVARRAGVGVETVRFYERQGLIEKPPRRLSGYREYDDEVVSRLGFIRRAKELGFTLKEIKELLSLRRDPSTPAADVKRRAEAKIADIETKIRTLQRMKKALGKLTSACRGHATSAECPLLHALDQEEG